MCADEFFWYARANGFYIFYFFLYFLGFHPFYTQTRIHAQSYTYTDRRGHIFFASYTHSHFFLNVKLYKCLVCNFVAPVSPYICFCTHIWSIINIPYTHSIHNHRHTQAYTRTYFFTHSDKSSLEYRHILFFWSLSLYSHYSFSHSIPIYMLVSTDKT